MLLVYFKNVEDAIKCSLALKGLETVPSPFKTF